MVRFTGAGLLSQILLLVLTLLDLLGFRFAWWVLLDLVCRVVFAGLRLLNRFKWVRFGWSGLVGQV